MLHTLLKKTKTSVTEEKLHTTRDCGPVSFLVASRRPH